MTPAEAILERIQRRLRILGMSENAAGELAGSREIVRTIRRGVERSTQYGVSLRNVQRIAPVLGTTAEWLLNGTGPEEAGGAGVATTQPDPQTGQKDSQQRASQPLAPFAADLPVIGTAAGSILGDFAGLKMQKKVANYIIRPPCLAAVPNAYAVEISGRSMEPMFRAGDICVVDPNAAPQPGDAVIVQTQHYDSDPGQTYVKILRARTASRLVLEQINPPATLEIPRDYVASTHKVMTVRDLLTEG